MSKEHLQTDKPIANFMDWKLEVFELFAKAWKIDKIMASKRIKESELKSWYDDGFTPYLFFRENYTQLFN